MTLDLTRTVLQRLREQFIAVENSGEWYSCTLTMYSLGARQTAQRSTASTVSLSSLRIEQKSIYRPHWIQLQPVQRDATGEIVGTFGRLSFITKLSAEMRFFQLARQFENCFDSLPASVWSLFFGEFDPRRLPMDFTQEDHFRAAFRWVLMVYALARLRVPGLPAISRSDHSAESEIVWPISTYHSWLQIPDASELSRNFILTCWSEDICDLFSASRSAIDVILNAWDRKTPNGNPPKDLKSSDDGDHGGTPTNGVSVNQIAAILKCDPSNVGKWSKNWGTPLRTASGRRHAIWDYAVVRQWLIDNGKATAESLPLIPPPHVPEHRHNRH